MDYFSSDIGNLIGELAKLPGIGLKSAQRLAFYLVQQPQERALGLADALIKARQTARTCECCCTLTDQPLCPICASPARNHRVIMVVENTRDLAAYEKTGKYEGVYHVLQGIISPMLGIGPGDIKLKELVARVTDAVEEIIIALNTSAEGDATSVYISKLVKPLGVKVSRIASGIPVGGDLEYIDELTLHRALEGRMQM
ncbi:MAG: recombination mediator RecR [Lachnospiraceae bacterium]|jgi:recombination protein RecR|nr:recombination mediator RecR [Lachnospiraceae bacterium]